MGSYRFNTAKRYDLLLYYSRTNTSLCIIAAQHILYQGIAPTQFLVLYFMQGFIQKIRATTSHKKMIIFKQKNPFFSFQIIFKKKTALSTFTTFQESSSAKRALSLLVKCLSCYTVVEIVVISVVFIVFSLNMG